MMIKGMLNSWPWFKPMAETISSSHCSCTSFRNSMKKRKVKMLVRQKPKKKPVPMRFG